MSMLSKLSAMSGAELKSKLQTVDAAAVKSRGLRRKFEKIRAKEGGFTLLELLVVVAILAAIAGTATIMLQDTDRKGAAAAHVAMMDELSKGIQTYRVLNGGVYPDIWDSLLASADGSMTGAAKLAIVSDDLAGNLDFAATVNTAEVAALNAAGIHLVRVVNTSSTIPGYAGTASCANDLTDTGIQALINDKSNDVTPQNIFRIPEANGCGDAAHHELADGDTVAEWTGGPERVGVPIGAPAGTNRLVAFGIGPDSTLFEPTRIGAMSNSPVYRHVASDEYNRFIVLFNLNPTLQVWEDGTGYVHKAGGGQVSFQAIIDGAGDTKDEELGEVDNVRPT
jgi:prepilin-type N-terminal cleavage/methylation domain-containing protein